MGIEISMIENLLLRGLAYKIDTNNDYVLNDNNDEISIFKKKAGKELKKGNVTQAEFNQAMGLHMTKPVSDVQSETKTATETATEKTINPNYELTTEEIYVLAGTIGAVGLDKKYAGKPELLEFGKRLQQAAREGKLSADAMYQINILYKDLSQKISENETLNQELLMQEAAKILSKSDNLKLQDAIKTYITSLGEVIHKCSASDNLKVKQKELKKATKKYAKDGTNNHYINKAARQEGVKILTGDKARELTVYFHTMQTKSEIEDVLNDKKRNERITLDELIKRGAIVRMVPGMYDLRPLVDKIIEGVGLDFENSRTHRDIKPETGEFEQTRRLVGSEFGYTDENGGPLTDHELKKLMKLVGVPTEHKDWGKILLSTVAGTIAGGTISYYTMPGLEIVSNNEQNVNILIGQGDKITVTNLNQVRLIKDWTHYVPKGAIIGAALGMLEGLPDSPEIPVASISGDTYEELCNYLDASGKKAPVRKYKEIIKLLALYYTEPDGTLKQEFRDIFHNTVGGENGVINKKELIRVIGTLDSDETPYVDPSLVDTTPACTSDTPCEMTFEEVYDENCTTEFVVKKGDTWSTIIHTYYEDVLKEYGWKQTLNALREATGAKATDTDLPMLTKTVDGKKVKYMNLPCELLGVSINEQNLDTNRTKYVADKYETDVNKIKRSVGKEVSAPEQIGYNAKDGCTDETAFGKTQEEAALALREKTGKEYQ